MANGDRWIHDALSSRFGSRQSQECRKVHATIQLLDKHQDTEINETSLEDDYPEKAELVLAQARQALISLCEGEALEIVKNTSRGQHFGLEALRQLITKYDPQNPQANLALLKKALRL